MDRPGRPNIADVARLAGVHASTVSRALDPAARHRISAAVAERVAAAAEHLGYRAFGMLGQQSDIPSSGWMRLPHSRQPALATLANMAYNMKGWVGLTG